MARGIGVRLNFGNGGRRLAGMARKRPDRSRRANAHVASIAAFRKETILPLLAEVRPTVAQHRLARDANHALLALADDLAGETDTLIAPGHRNPDPGGH